MITERHVQAIWYDRAFRPERLFAVGRSTASGGEVRVVDPGSWNLGPGPDFRDAVLEIGRERRRVRGDVEVHLSPGDWDAHRHGGDPAYRRVIAHVTWGCGPTPPSLPEGAVSIWLGRFLSSDTGFSPDAIDLDAYPFARLPADERPCCRALASDPDRAHRVLAEAGRRRLSDKAARLRRRLAAGADRTQLFYSEFMGALGYGRNASAFRAIAAAVPYRCIVSEPENAASMLLAAAGFADVFWGGRPRNSPVLRLGAAAQLFAETDVMRLMRTDDFSPSGCRGILALMTDRRLIGRGRAAAVLANVVVPWALALGHIGSPPEWLPPEDLSEPVRLTAFRMFGRDHNPAAFYANNDVLVQGLIGICRTHCLAVHPDCRACRLLVV